MRYLTLLVLPCCMALSAASALGAEFDANSPAITNPYLPLSTCLPATYEGYGELAGYTVREYLSGQGVTGGINSLMITREWRRADTIVDSTTRWYAQDTQGAVWLLRRLDNLTNEDSGELAVSQVLDTLVFMPTSPQPGDTIRDYRSMAHGYANVEEVAISLSPLPTGVGPFTNVVSVRDNWDTSGGGGVDYLLYAPGVGMVKEAYDNNPGLDGPGGMYLTENACTSRQMENPTTTGLPSAVSSLAVTATGTQMTVSWEAVASATGYTLFYAPYPDASYIGSLDLGSATSLSVALWPGAAFYVAVKAYNAVGSSDYSSIERVLVP